MSFAPQVSIIIPVYNAAQFLRETVQSVIGQLFEDYELLIVNDGSTDDTLRIIKELKEKDDRIYAYEQANSGVSAARNFGLARAQGQFVVFLDADDLLLPDFLQSRIDFLSSHPQTGSCGSEVTLIDEHGGLKTETTTLRAPGENMLEEILFYERGVTTIPSNLMHRRSLLNEHQITFDLRLSSSADRLFLCKLARVGRVHCLATASLYYRVHADSMYHDPSSKKTIFKDNELFVNILVQEQIVPEELRYRFFLKNYYMLAGAGWKAKYYSAVLLYGWKYLVIRAKSFL